MSAIDNQALAWLRKQSERELDADERAALDAWLEADTRHKGAYVRALVIDNAISQAVSDQDVHPGEDRYGLRSDGYGSAKASRRTWLKYGALAAGVAILGVGVSLQSRDSVTTLATSTGEFRRVALADTSIANLNSDSKLEVRFTTARRQVDLVKGEAWFEVAKDKHKPFVVAAAGVEVRAVGTAFGVRRFPNGAEVLVTEGTVEVWTGRARARLGAGERSFLPYNAARITVTRQPEEIQRKLAWRDGNLQFTRQTLGEAVADFNRYSARQIVIADRALESERIFGQYRIDAPEQFAKDIGAYLNVPVEVSAERIVIGAKHP
ncbi:FecR family protein [Massilia sp. GER05]|uniref:FecR family protein n=1 Tax=unclassified Massilia TaxID=2609279 RepID=UPI0039AE99A9